MQVRKFLLTALLLAPVIGQAQAPADPSGHWEGGVQTPNGELKLQIDLAKNQNGDFAGTISIPAQNLKGLPLRKVSLDGRQVQFYARSDQPFYGALSPDDKSMSGNLSFSGYSLPMDMTRTGDATIAAPAKLAPIGKELEGTWEGTLEVEGMRFRLGLTMSNQPGGVTAKIVNLDQGELEVPVSALTQTASGITLELEAIGASYIAALNKEGTELSGTYKQAAVSAPLVYRRSGRGQQ